jgi:hypothetical protein
LIWQQQQQQQLQGCIYPTKKGAASSVRACV